MIELSGIVMSYGSTPVLRGIDLAIAEGSVTALIGPSTSSAFPKRERVS